MNDIHFVTENEKAERLIDKPHCLDVRMFDEHLVGIEMRKVKVLLNKPSYVGFAVLELSKLLMLRYSNSLLVSTHLELFSFHIQMFYLIIETISCVLSHPTASTTTS